VLLQTVLDAVVRSGVGFVVNEKWRGAALWVVAGREATLVASSGSCRPGGDRWPASLLMAAEVAAARGASIGHLPMPLARVGIVGGLPLEARRRRTVLGADSEQKLRAFKFHYSHSAKSSGIRPS